MSRQSAAEIKDEDGQDEDGVNAVHILLPYAQSIRLFAQLKSSASGCLAIAMNLSYF